MFKGDFFKDNMLHNMLENHLQVYINQIKTKSENELHSEIQPDILWKTTKIAWAEF